MVIIRGVHPGFEVTEMIAAFFAFEIFDSRIFWVGKDFLGSSKQYEASW